MKTIEIELVQGADGTVDVEQTLAVAADAINEYKVKRETETDTIRTHLDAVFDTLRENGTRANMPFIVSSVLQRLNVAAMPAAYKTLEARVQQFIRDNSQGKLLDKEQGTVERPDSYLVVSRGKSTHGSIIRRADLNADQAAAEASAAK